MSTSVERPLVVLLLWLTLPPTVPLLVITSPLYIPRLTDTEPEELVVLLPPSAVARSLKASSDMDASGVNVSTSNLFHRMLPEYKHSFTFLVTLKVPNTLSFSMKRNL
jgi:hypothetical protein